MRVFVILKSLAFPMFRALTSPRASRICRYFEAVFRDILVRFLISSIVRPSGAFFRHCSILCLMSLVNDIGYR